MINIVNDRGLYVYIVAYSKIHPRQQRRLFFNLPCWRGCILEYATTCIVTAIILGLWSCSFMSYRHFGYEKVYLPLCKVAHKPFHIQLWSEIIYTTLRNTLQNTSDLLRCTQIYKLCDINCCRFKKHLTC